MSVSLSLFRRGSAVCMLAVLGAVACFMLGVPRVAAAKNSAAPRPAQSSVAWRGGQPRGPYALTSPGALPRLRGPDGALLPLRRTHVEADLRGPIAEVRVAQVFRNDSTDPIEVVYTFPLPENSAVSDLKMVVSDRVIESEIMRRSHAQRQFEQARQAGHTAALLEQERPNVFTQSVTNIAPGEDIEVEIRYLQTLTYDSGRYEFVFPMVVGPRFVPGRATGHQGSGVLPDTDAVPDASRISPPIAGAGTRTGNDISIHVRAEAGHPILSWESVTHEIEAVSSGGRLSATLARRDRLPNRDFVLRYRVAGAAARATAFFGPRGTKGDGHYVMVVHPPDLDVDAQVGRREFIFVVDQSGSMSGRPLGLAKQAVRELLGHLRPVDTFDVIGFSSGTQRLFAQPRPANDRNLLLALEFIDGLRAGGGTMMDGAVQDALRRRPEPGFNRYVLMLTDGFIGNENDIFTSARHLTRQVERGGQVARVFGIGIGSSPNQHLIEGISRAGRGNPHYVRSREDPARAINALMHKVDHAVITGLSLRDEALTVEAYPAQLPDLFASHPIVVVGRYRGAPPSSASIGGWIDGRAVTIPVTISTLDEDSTTMGALWARAKVRDLTEALWQRPDLLAYEEQVTELGLRHNIVTPFTSLLAVDRSRRVPAGPRRQVLPHELPEDTVMQAAVAQRDSAGISLAGSTGAESRYTVEGANVNNPAFGTIGASMVQRVIMVDQPDLAPRGPATAHVRIRLDDGDRSRQARATLRGRRAKLRRALRVCVETSPVYKEQSSQQLELRITRGPRGSMTITIETGSLGTTKADTCVRHAVRQVLHGTTLPGAITLHVRASAR